MPNCWISVLYGASDYCLVPPQLLSAFWGKRSVLNASFCWELIPTVAKHDSAISPDVTQSEEPANNTCRSTAQYICLGPDYLPFDDRYCTEAFGECFSHEMIKIKCFAFKCFELYYHHIIALFSNNGIMCWQNIFRRDIEIMTFNSSSLLLLLKKKRRLLCSGAR